MDFFKYRNKIQPEKGRLLISEPFLPDPNFERTVVLLCEHNEEGSFGFVLNKPSILKVGEVMEDITDLDNLVYVGGPVQQDTLHFIHRNTQLENAVEIVEQIYWGGAFDNLMLLCQTRQITGKDIRFFLGYSGWGPGQLDEEVAASAWLTGDIDIVDNDIDGLIQRGMHEVLQQFIDENAELDRAIARQFRFP